LGEVPTARVAVLVHTGSYDTIGDTYRSLGAWVARHAEHAGERVREWYVVGPTDTDDPDELRTEISWPIRPTS
jgi:effector-binding domain-containing protein